MDTLPTIEVILAVIGLLITGSTALIGVTVFITKQNKTSEDKLRAYIDSKYRESEAAIKEVNVAVYNTSDKIRQNVDNLDQKFILVLDKRDSENSKFRHDSRNEVQGMISKFDLRVERLERDGVQKTEMEAMERRIGLQITEMKELFKEQNATLQSIPVLHRDISDLKDLVKTLVNPRSNNKSNGND